jgi:hypothetical protein
MITELLVGGGAGAVFAGEMAAIWSLIARDESDDEKHTADDDAEIAAWDEWIAPALDEETAPLAWPLRQTPTDLAAAYTGELLPARPINASWNVDTAAWNQMITVYTSLSVGGVEAGDWWCDSCRVGRDGERRHWSCRGCGCGCTTAAGVGEFPVGDRDIDLIEELWARYDAAEVAS